MKCARNVSHKWPRFTTCKMRKTSRCPKTFAIHCTMPGLRIRRARDVLRERRSRVEQCVNLSAIAREQRQRAQHDVHASHHFVCRPTKHRAAPPPSHRENDNSYISFLMEPPPRERRQSKASERRAALGAVLMCNGALIGGHFQSGSQSIQHDLYAKTKTRVNSPK